MKRIAETLGVARSNLIERAGGKRPKRGPQTRAGDAELTSDIRRLVDSRPSYGYPRSIPIWRCGSTSPRIRTGVRWFGSA